MKARGAEEAGGERNACLRIGAPAIVGGTLFPAIGHGDRRIGEADHWWSLPDSTARRAVKEENQSSNQLFVQSSAIPPPAPG